MKNTKIVLVYPNSENLMSIYVKYLQESELNKYMSNLCQTIYIIDNLQYKFTSLYMCEDELFINIIVNIKQSNIEVPLLPTDYVIEIDNTTYCMSLNNL